MDEKDQILTVGDILDQLIKPSVVQGPVTQVPQPKATPPPSAPSFSQGQSGGVALPDLSKGKPLAPRVDQSGRALPSARPSELRLSIRTMKDDIARLRQGQRPSGEVKRSIAPVIGKKDIFLPRIKQELLTQPSPLPPPTIPSQLPPLPRFLPPSLPPSRSTPLPPMPDQLPPIPSVPRKPAHIHEEIRILDKDNLPAFLGAPIPKKKDPGPEHEKIEYGVIAKIIGSGMTTGIVGTMIVAIAAYGLIYYFFLREEPMVVATPSPTPIETTPTTEANELEIIFRSVPATAFSLPADTSQAVPELRSFIDRETLDQAELRRINFMITAEEPKLTFTQLLNKLALSYPTDLTNWIKDTNMAILYGQEGTSDGQGGADKRIVFIVEINSVPKVTEIMMSWEGSIAEDLKNLFDIDPSQQATATFLDNEREGAKIRYKNFPFPSKSVDYAIVPSLTGRYYLILSNSRESMYSPLDKIRGL